jgi:YesN/AraC family two-component response regulator
MFTARMERHSPMKVQQLSELMFSAVTSAQGPEMDGYQAAAAKHKIQLAMGEQIQQRKRAVLNTPSSKTCAELELAFEELLRGKDLNAALDCMNQLINELVLVEGGNFDSIKIRILGTFLNLVQAATENGIPLRKIFGNDLHMFTTLSQVENIKDLSVWAEDTARAFYSEVFSDFSYLSPTTAQAVAYLADHYMEKITLRELSATLFVSDSYLSKLFRQELGISFTEYLNKVRVDRSIDLIKEGKYSLLEIAGMVGFDDQSYFTKVFKKYAGVTPRRYKEGDTGDRP